MWMASIVAVAFFALIGGSISLLFKRKSLVELSSDAGDDEFYDQVASELKDNNLIPGLWTKAYSKMNGDEAKARALYIKYRIKQLHGKTAIENEQQKAKDTNSQGKFKSETRLASLTAEATKSPRNAYDKFVVFSIVIVCIFFALILLFCYAASQNS